MQNFPKDEAADKLQLALGQLDSVISTRLIYTGSAAEVSPSPNPTPLTLTLTSTPLTLTLILTLTLTRARRASTPRAARSSSPRRVAPPLPPLPVHFGDAGRRRSPTTLLSVARKRQQRPALIPSCWRADAVLLLLLLVGTTTQEWLTEILVNVLSFSSDECVGTVDKKVCVNQPRAPHGSLLRYFT